MVNEYVIVAPYDFTQYNGNTIRPIMHALGLQRKGKSVIVFCLKPNPRLNLKQVKIDNGVLSFLPRWLRFKNSGFIFDFPYMKKLRIPSEFHNIHIHNYYSSLIMPKDRSYFLDLHTYKSNEVKNVHMQKYYNILHRLLGYAASKIIKLIEIRAMQKCTKVLVAGDNIKKIILKETNIESDKIIVIPNCLDFAQYTKNKYLSKYTIGVIGPFDHMNSELLTHVTNIAKKVDEQFILIGSVDKQLLKQNKLGPNVKITGWLPSEEYLSLLAQLSVVFLPYFCYRDGGGLRNKILEPAACGTPIITTSAGSEGFPGELLLIGNNYEDLIKHIVMMKKTEVREQLGARLRNYVNQNHNHIHIAEKLLKVYNENTDNN